MNKNNGIYINSTGQELRIAVIESGKLVEINVERIDDKKVVGDIYKGVVTQVSSGLNAAFVDIGLEKAAFLPLTEMISKYADFEKNVDSGKLKLESGQEIFIQITKSPLGKKGPRATSFISIPGRYLVLMPGRKFIGISKKIKDRNEKKRLKKIGNKLQNEKFGLILRTESKFRTEMEIAEDLKDLKSSWKEMEKAAKNHSAPYLLHKEEEPVIKIIRDLFNSTIDEVVTDSKEIYRKILSYLKTRSGSKQLKDKITYHREEIPLFEYYGIEDEIAKLFSPYVELSSGAYIIIEETEALISIDVNSGKSPSNLSPEDMAYNTNIAAAREIARQLRLRNTGGLIVIDFIDMQQYDHKKAVKAELDRQLAKDKASYITSPISDFGLLEMTRKRTGPSILKSLQRKCPYCQSSGFLFAEHFITSSLQRWLRSISNKIQNKSIQIRCSKELANFISYHLDGFFHKLSRTDNLSIEVVEDSTMYGDDLKIWSINDNQEISNWEGGVLPVKD
ncbi:MAG: hypothetical protein APR63_10295 [Desulfuromonas sp. SDB]|nr:MAG: hypothetical protein APR63_10295 [Desulfuromonas sp. SDB]